MTLHNDNINIQTSSWKIWVAIFVPFIFIAFTIFGNLPPKDMIFAGGDIYTWLDYNKAYTLISSPWMDMGDGYFNGEYPSALLYLLASWLTSLLGLDGYLGLLWFNYTIFVFGAYLSAFLALRIIDPRESLKVTVFFAISYAFHAFLIRNVFLIPNGSNAYYYIYVFFPLLFVLYLKSTASDALNKYTLCLAWLVFAFSFFTSNIGFLYALCIVFFILSLLISYYSARNSGYFRQCLINLGVILVPTCWVWLVNILGLSYMLIGSKGNSTQASASDWVIGSAVEIYNLFLGLDIYAQYVQATNGYQVLLITPAFIAIAGLLVVKKERAVFLAVITVLLFIIFLLSRGLPVLSKDVAEAIFGSVFFLPVRSPDKFLVFIPFLFITVIFWMLKEISLKYRFAVLAMYSVYFLVSSWPIISQGIETKYSLSHPGIPVEDTHKYARAFFVKIPEDYKVAGQTVGDLGCSGKILSMPYGWESSEFWVSYKWKYFGSDITTQFFPCPTININNWKLAHEFDYGARLDESLDSGESIEWFMHYIRDRSVEFIIFHRDVHEDFIVRGFRFIKKALEAGHISSVYESDNIEVYRLTEKVVPRIHVTDVSDNVSSNLFESRYPVLYQKRFWGYSVDVQTEHRSISLTFTDTYHPLFFLLPSLNIDRLFRTNSIVRVDNPSGTNSWEIDIERYCTDNSYACKNVAGKAYINLNIVFIPSMLVPFLFCFSLGFVILLTFLYLNKSRLRWGIKSKVRL